MNQYPSKEIRFDILETALKTLKESLEPPPHNLRERDGSIQRFEYTFELTWKVAKRVLGEQGIEALTPKNVIRELAHQGWIENPEIWFSFLSARNQSSHTHKELTAVQVFQAASQFPASCESLIKRLKQESMN